MKKKIITASITASWLLTGCVSSSDFAVVQSQVNRLNAQVTTMESTVATLQEELAVVKGQRVVRLPTGAPTVTRARSTQQPDYAISEEQKLFESAVGLYKSGNAQAAIQQFERFNTIHPNSRYHSEVLYYLGDASYTMRDYNRAQSVLEELVYQTPMDKVNPKAVDLLGKVYQARGESAKIQELKSFVQSLQKPANEPPVLSPLSVFDN